MLNSTVSPSVITHPFTTTSIFTTWVNNVYNLWAQGVKTSANLYTAVVKILNRPKTMWVKPDFSTLAMNTFPPTSYTVKMAILPQENTYLYTVSTAPTITKTEEKKKGI